MNSALQTNANQILNTTTGNKENYVKENPTKSNAIEIPSITLPKGGGALKGIDEKFQVNAANGTAAYSIPLPISPGRNGFTPALSLSYNSGSGNSAFGLGWDIGLPSIQRKTDKKLPRYREGSDEDTFMFSGVEDLVPCLYEPDNWKSREENKGGYLVKRYRPRIEGSFSKIEKITHNDHGVYWKATTRENVATFFGRNKDCRIADPEDDTRVFQWLPEFSYDDKGNWMLYEYKSDSNINDNSAVTQQLRDAIPNEPHEQNRKNGNALFINRYLKHINYGNRISYYVEPDKAFDPQPPEDTEHFFEVVFDYGDHNLDKPSTTENNQFNPGNYRPDAFSNYHAGFEIRTARLCKRILMFHHFKDEPNFGVDYLVRSLDFIYGPSSINNSGINEVTYLKTIVQSGYIRKPGGAYSKKSLPPLEFQYQQLVWNTEIKEVNTDSIINAPVGLTNNYQWVDFYGEGVSGIFTEQDEGWYYKSNLGVDENGELQLAPARMIAPKPSFTGIDSGVLQLMDLDANGEKQVMVNTPEIKGFFQLTDQNDWEPFRSFLQSVNIDLRDPNVRTIDLNGDGMPELVVTEENVFIWFASEGKKGYAAAEFASKAFDEEKGPAIVFADSLQTIFLADMSGDGMTDIVRIRNGDICYWPNMGYGKFGAKVSMGNAPVFDSPDQFNPGYLHLADVSGTGATDIIYTGKNKCTAYLNLSGNKWNDGYDIETLPSVQYKSQLAVIDLLGTGTSCIVWSSDLPGDAQLPMRYINLMSSRKPHVMVKRINDMGLETTVDYKSSTWFYLQDKKAGRPWITKLPFPVQVVASTTVEEKITNVTFTTQYSYHHGYYDHAEREFRGFGRVEQLDTEQYEDWKINKANTTLDNSEPLFQKPVLTKTWFHTGAFLDKEKILTQFETEYWYNEMERQGFAVVVKEPALPDAQVRTAAIIQDKNIIENLSADEWREALRACKGMVLRQEIFALDAPANGATDEELKLQLTPYSVAAHNCNIQLLQPRNINPFAVFISTESESIQIHYERNLKDPRVAHTLNVIIDDLGNVKEMASVVYPRLVTDNSLPAETQAAQHKTTIVYTKSEFTKDVNNLDDAYRLRLPSEVKTFEFVFDKPKSFYTLPDFDDILNDDNSSTAEYYELDKQPGEGKAQKRLIEHVRTNYLKNDLSGTLPLHALESLALPFENYQLAYTPGLLSNIYNDKVNDDELANLMKEGKFIHSIDGSGNEDANWWIGSGTIQFISDGENLKNAQDRFYVPVAYSDPFNSKTSVKYNDYFLFIKETEDELGNTSGVDAFNFRTLSPQRMHDINNNLSEVVTDELGLVKAMALLGKANEADDLVGITEITEQAEKNLINDFFNVPVTATGVVDSNALRQKANDLLQQATARFVYDFDVYKNKGKPVVVASVMREQHFRDNNSAPVQLSFEYSNGTGKAVMKKVQAKPGKALKSNGEGTTTLTDTNPFLRWIGNGRTVLNNKGNPVKQYEPYFSLTYQYEDANELVETGVTPVMYYDALGRLVKTDMPDGTFSKTAFDSWKQTVYDQNDTVLESKWYLQRTDNTRTDFINDPAEQQAAQKTAKHANTPAVQHFDTLGRPVLSVEYNKTLADADEFHFTKINLDIEGNARKVTDACGNDVMSYKYDMLGHRVYQDSMDAGRRWLLHNVMGNPLRTWDEKNQEFQYAYDVLHRPLQSKVIQTVNGIIIESMFDKIEYGESLMLPDRSDKAVWQAKNLLGQVSGHFDTAGIITSNRYDFKGNLLQTSRQLLEKYDDVHPVDWNDGQILEADLYATVSAYDALNRNWKTVTPDNSVQYHLFNESGHLEKVLLNHRREINITAQDETTDALKANTKNLSVFVISIDYNEKGQRSRIVYGNNSITSYTYDEKTFRLSTLKTTSQDGRTFFQDLLYTYDPVGNITRLSDVAHKPVYSDNNIVEPIHDYEYDAVYRLVLATGREHKGQNVIQENDQNKNYRNFPFKADNLPKPGDVVAMRNYTQKFTYDKAGNILKLEHKGDDNTAYTRNYTYNNTSVDINKNNNRLLSTQVNGDPLIPYDYDAHGNMIVTGVGISKKGMPHLSRMDWNFKDELFATAQTVMNAGTPATTFYVYDAGGIRVRKITNGQSINTKIEERIYLGGYEIYRSYNNDGTTKLERQTLHVMDDKSRIAMVETKTTGDDNTTKDKAYIHYQYSNHLGSACLELNEKLEIISYEEYHPYGTTAYQAMNADINPVAKRYRYTGLERDEENGFGYHNARYYVPWLARWVSCDPIGINDGTNIYAYCKDNSVTKIDLNGKDEKKIEDARHDIENDLEKLRNVRGPGILFGLMPYHTMPYLRDQSIPIRNPYLRLSASVLQQKLRAMDRVTTEVGMYAFQEAMGGVLPLAELAIPARVSVGVLNKVRLGASLPKAAPIAVLDEVKLGTSFTKTATSNTLKEIKLGASLHKRAAAIAQEEVNQTMGVVERAHDIKERLVKAGLNPVAANKSTVSVVEGILKGTRTRIITVTNSRAYKLLSEGNILAKGEILGSKPGFMNWTGFRNRFALHAEQIGVNDASRLGMKSGTIGTSNLGCEVCQSAIEEFFPGFVHLNPKRKP
ncbi:MAG TPA: SpvB/TcaC N-terminal domain-containing protein [Parafilimonas sp.]|nr:SpvB/TcaC N-terminal domain-containing protein [Parafilimonas sp.]